MGPQLVLLSIRAVSRNRMSLKLLLRSGDGSLTTANFVAHPKP